MSEIITPEQNSSSAPSPTSGKRSPLSWVIGLIAVAIIAGGAYWYFQGQKLSDNLTLQEIEKLGPDEQRIELEKQLKEYEERAAKLSADANISDKYLVYIRLAELQNRLQKYGGAIESVDKIAEQRQDNSRIWYSYAVSYQGLDNFPKAKENIQKALAISDVTPEYWIVYLEISQDLPSADLEKLYVEAVAKTANDLEIVKSYARFLEKIGNKEKAIGYWETARNINPDGAGEYDAEIARLRN